MSKELNSVEANIEILDDPENQSTTELNDLGLALVGGGAVSVIF